MTAPQYVENVFAHRYTANSIGSVDDDLDLDSNKIINLQAGTERLDAVNYEQFTDELNTLTVAGFTGNMEGEQIYNVKDPIEDFGKPLAQSAVTVNYLNKRLVTEYHTQIEVKYASEWQ